MSKKKKNLQPRSGNLGADNQAMGIPQALDIALRHHRSGNLQAAESIYHQVLNYRRDHPVALHLLGVAAHQRGRWEEASDLIGRAIAAKPDFPEAYANLGNALREMGKHEAAEAAFRKAIALNVNFAMAHYNLGTLLMGMEKYERAAESLQQALAAAPDLVEAHINLGIVFRELGMMDESAGCYRKALALRPGSSVAYFNLGNTLMEKGSLVEASASYEQALALDPGYTAARLNLGAVLRDMGRLDEAADCYEKSLAEIPDNAEACVNLGAVLRDMGKPGQAESWYRRALVLNPDAPLAHFNLGNALRDQGRSEEAAAAFRQAAELEPDNPYPYANLGNALRDMGKQIEAVDVYRKALELDPDNADLLVNLGNARKEMGNFLEAAAIYERAINLNPEMAEAHYNLGTVFQDQCRMEEAVACFRKTLELKPGHTVAHSNLLMNIQYDPEMTPEKILEESREWERMQLAGISVMPPPGNAPDPERKLRIGYVSGDLRRHPVGYFLDGVLASHDSSRFEIFCYANQSFGDDLTGCLKSNSGRWREIFGQSDTETATMIREDGIDILVDLSGHTARNRLKVFAMKPAPVQATWAGYVGTTGLSAMDYLISDERETPEGVDHWYRERIVRLPECYVCYAPPGYAPEVTPLPARTNGYITFGCFNNLAKLNERVAGLWSKLLAQLPDSRLLLVTKALSDPFIRERVLEMFAKNGVAERLVLSGSVPHRELLDRYGKVDITLDPFPYSGGLTTLESLWMGVPVITLGGYRFASRHSLSHMTAVGLPQFIARDGEDYICKAIDLSGDLPGLEQIRMGLRQRTASSPLCDHAEFTRNLEKAFRSMWRQWCKG
jgi:protein O-GlcNAc transferase